MGLKKDGIITKNNLTPTEIFLSQNYPDSFSDKTSIKYCVVYRTRVLFQMFNIYGELIKTLVDEEKDTGTYKYDLDISLYHSLRGRQLGEGTYICQLKAGDYLEQKELIYSSKIRKKSKLE